MFGFKPFAVLPFAGLPKASSVTVALTGASASGNVGSTTPNLSNALTNVVASGAVGTVTATTQNTLTSDLASSAAGTVSNVSVAAISNVLASGSVGNVIATQPVIVALTGVIAVGAVGNQGDSEIADVTSVTATGSVGSVTQAINITLSGVSANGQPGSVEVFNPLPIIDIDTHDGDKLKDRFAREKALREKRRKEVLALYERIVEGKEDIPEVVEPLKYITKQQILTSNLNFDKLIADLKNAEQIWIQHVENDDEEILLLL